MNKNHVSKSSKQNDIHLDYSHDGIFRKNMLLIVVRIMKLIDFGHINSVI